MPVMHTLISIQSQGPSERAQHPKTLNTKQALKTPSKGVILLQSVGKRNDDASDMF